MNQEKLQIIQESQPLISQPHGQTDGSVLYTIDNESVDENNNEIVTFDEVLNKIDQGTYQIVIYIVLALIGMTEGSQITIFTLTIPILKNEWNVEEHLDALQASLLFCGLFIGSMISGQFSDRYGRRIPFLISSLLTMIVIIVSAFSVDIYMLITTRFIMAILSKCSFILTIYYLKHHLPIVLIYFNKFPFGVTFYYVRYIKLEKNGYFQLLSQISKSKNEENKILSPNKYFFVNYSNMEQIKNIQTFLYQQKLQRIRNIAPLGMTILAEITPQHLRGRYMSLIVISVSIGQVYTFSAGYFILDGLSGGGNWRYLTIATVVPGLISLIVVFFWLDESARYLLCLGEYEKCFQILQRMNNLNGRKVFQELSESNKNGLRNWSKKLNEQFKNEDKASITALFKGDLIIITPILWITLFTLSFIYFGILMLLPALIHQISKDQANEERTTVENDDMTKLIFSGFTEMIACILAAFLVEIQGFGRKNSMISSGIIQGITCYMVYYDDVGRLVFWATLAKFYQTMNYAFTCQYLTEAYSTKIRTTGIGTANSFGKVGSIFFPWVCHQVQKINLLAPFVVFSIASFTISIIVSFLPFDTLGRDIDKIGGSESEKQNSPKNQIKLAQSFISAASPKSKLQSTTPQSNKHINIQSVFQRFKQTQKQNQQKQKQENQQQNTQE